ncbi:MAG: STAS domain-containing protein [Actinomycetota bacterium]|nr:STAS domain-containing protein [Actinomycetota bacterium]
MSAEVHIEVARDGAESVMLSVTGEIDLSNVGHFRAALDLDAATLVVDLGGVTYIDSAGMAALFDRARRGRLEVRCQASSVVSPLIDITRLCDVAVIRRD